jgi:hypothetical protein
MSMVGRTHGADSDARVHGASQRSHRAGRSQPVIDRTRARLAGSGTTTFMT